MVCSTSTQRKQVELASPFYSLAGGASALAARAAQVAEGGDLRLACELAEWAGLAAPDDKSVHGTRAEIYPQRRRSELSLMARGVYGDASRRSQAISEGE